LNRTGRWAEAEEACLQLLKQGSSSSAVERCQTRNSLVYARVRLGKLDDARAALKDFDEECGEVEKGSWLQRETSKLRQELGAVGGPDPQRADDGWGVADDPAKLGLNTAALDEHEKLCRDSGADACLVAYRGKIVQEWYGPEYREPMYTMSSMKSWTAILTGMLIADGKIGGVEDEVSKYVPQWKAGAAAGVRIEHLLNMTSGIEKGTNSVGFASDKNAYVLGLGVTGKPGETWAYSNEGAQMLSPVLEQAAGQPLEQYAKERLFEPLKMIHTQLNLDAAGSPWTYADAKTTLRDFAKICELVRLGGEWDGKRIVSEDWLDKMLSPGEKNPTYGLLWWLMKEPLSYDTRGHLSTDCYAMPELGLVVARMQSKEKKVSVSYGDPKHRQLFKKMVTVD